MNDAGPPGASSNLFEAAGITMPDSPTWDQVADAARKLTDKDKLGRLADMTRTATHFAF